MLWRGIDWHVEKIRARRVVLDWGGSLVIALSFALAWLAKYPKAWLDILFEFYGITNSVLITAALLSIRRLLNSNRDVQQSHRMMLIHLLIFNLYAVSLLMNWIVYYGFEAGIFHLTTWQNTMTNDTLLFVEELAYFIMVQFIAYLIIRFGNPEDKSQSLFFKMLTF